MARSGLGGGNSSSIAILLIIIIIISIIISNWSSGGGGQSGKCSARGACVCESASVYVQQNVIPLLVLPF